MIKRKDRFPIKIRKTFFNQNPDPSVKLCYLANASSIHTYRWAVHFSLDHEVHIISLEEPRFDYKSHGIEIHKISPTLPLAGLRVKSEVKKIGPDILHSHYITKYGFLGVLSGFHPLIVTGLGSDNTLIWRLVLTRNGVETRELRLR